MSQEITNIIKILKSSHEDHLHQVNYFSQFEVWFAYHEKTKTTGVCFHVQ